MFTRAKTKARYAWIVCLTILFTTFAPLISHAFEPAPGAVGQIEICTALGMKTVPLVQDGSSEPPPPTMSHVFDHCPYCNTHADSFALPTPSPAPLMPAPGFRTFPSLFYQAHQPLFAWTVANPRAPPAAL
jgi:hypothetical protein